ncbi:: ATPase_gene1 [Gemmataceae bacterium]|nr:: ATPase_gene1 [Gemmataceae bacterium]VTT97669.1 : ATPase_gene1 [Gemmataceae bacterium]
MSAGPPSAEPNRGPSMPLGFLMAGSEMATFSVVGLILDYYLGTMPGFTIGLTLLGLVASFFHLMQMAKVIARKKPKPGSGDGATGGAGA